MSLRLRWRQDDLPAASWHSAMAQELASQPYVFLSLTGQSWMRPLQQGIFQEASKRS
jgi:hypothetical protein